MSYEEVEEILCTKKNIPYPKLINIRANSKYAKILYDSLAGEKGELTTILQYTYENLEVNKYENFSKILLEIAQEEMKHLKLIGELIKKLGGKALYVNKENCIWNANYIKYYFNNIYDMLSYNIELEKQEIQNYKTIIKNIQSKTIETLIERIILDEQTHLEIFNRLR